MRKKMRKNARKAGEAGEARKARKAGEARKAGKIGKVNILKKYKSWFEALEYYDRHRTLPFEKTKILVSMSDEVRREFKEYCKKMHTNMSVEVERLVKGLLKTR